MKHLICILFAAMISVSAFAQDNLKTKEVYCEIVGTGNLTGTKVKIEIDFGQENKFWTQYKDKFLVDENGKPVKFNSMVHAMNHMSKLGWRFKQAIVASEASGMGKQNVYHFILGKEVSSEDEINEGLKMNN